MAAMKQVGGIWMLRRKKSNEYFGITLIRPSGTFSRRREKATSLKGFRET